MDQKLSSPLVFWFALAKWVRGAIVLVSAVPAFLVWLAVWTSLLPAVVLIFLGSNNAALIAKIIAVLAIGLTFVLAVVGVPLILFLIIYFITYLIVRARKSESPSDFFLNR